MLKNPLMTEAVVDQLISKIKSDFNTTVADIDNQYSDGIALEPIDETSIYISDKFQTLRPPAVHILFNNHAFQYTQDPNYLESEDECVVVVTSQDVGADRLTRKAWRYGRVLMGLFNLQDFSTTDSRMQLRTVPKRLGYSDPISGKLTDQGKKFRMDAVLELRILHYEKNLTT